MPMVRRKRRVSGREIAAAAGVKHGPAKFIKKIELN
jgi:hypothetical protein